MTKQLTYRLFQDEDLPSLLRLYEENTNWGTLSPELWRQYYLNTPHGRSLVVVAHDDNDDIVGQLIFVPSRVVVGDREVRALRLSVPIFRKDLSRASMRNTDHPFFRLFKSGEEMAIAAGYSLWYGLPRYGWLAIRPLLSRFIGREIATAEYACLGSPIVSTPSLRMGDKASFLTARPATDFGIQYEALWQSARDSFPITCGAVRGPDLLRYYSTRDLIILEVCDTRDDRLVGYTAINRKPPLLGDILARSPDSLASVLAVSLNWLATYESYAATDSMDHLNTMETPTLSPTLRALGFTPVDYKFLFACAGLDPSLPLEAIAPEQWYVTAGDHG